MGTTDYHYTKFVAVARQLSEQFPTLDLRFNHVDDESSMRCVLPDIEEGVLELDLSSETQTLLHQAILEIKALARLFDA
ncbi:MAG: hypothetical protein KDD69_13965 [Bdellovibrionales bacterium]|nr:hypothetical protein [Bdellovibrionales bacterium]